MRAWSAPILTLAAVATSTAIAQRVYDDLCVRNHVKIPVFQPDATANLTGAHMQKSQEISTKVIIGAGIAVLTLMAQQGSGPKPTCSHCPGTYIPVSELNAYTAKAIKYQLIDQQVRSVDIGKVQIGIGMVTRGKLLPDPNRKGAVAG